MEAHTELSKKATILFSPDLYDQLARLAKQRGTSVGELVRTACQQQYFPSDKVSRLLAVRELASLSLPVDRPQDFEAESAAAPGPLS